MSYPSATVCEAVGYSGSSGVILGSTDGGATWTSQSVPPGVTSLNSVSCGSVDACEAVGYYSDLLTFVTYGVVLGTTDGGPAGACR